MRYTGCDTRLDWPSAELAALISAGALPNGKALDLGCGNGSEALLLARFGWKVIGVDRNKKAIKDANQRKEDLPPKMRGRCEFIHADIFSSGKYQHKPFKFDLVIERLLFVNLKSARAYVRFFETCAYALKPGGLLVMRIHLKPSDWDTTGKPTNDTLEKRLYERYFRRTGPEVCFAGIASRALNPVAFRGGLTLDAHTLSIRVFKRRKKIPSQVGHKV